VGIEPQASLLRPDALHAAFSVTDSKNAFLSSPGRNGKNRRADCSRTSGFSFSRFAPAKVGTDHPDSSRGICPSPASRLRSRSPAQRPAVGSYISNSSCGPPIVPSPESRDSGLDELLPDRTSGGRKYVVCTASNHSDRPHYQNQNDGQHHRILSDILALLLRPELAKKSHVRTSVRLSTILRLTYPDLNFVTAGPIF
jgi:hypothetical protein